MLDNICTNLVRKLVELTESVFKSQYKNPKVYARIVSLIAVLLMALATSFLYFKMNGELVYNLAEMFLNYNNIHYDVKVVDDLTFFKLGLTIVASILMFIFTTKIILPYLNIATLRNNPDVTNKFVITINILLVIHAIIYILLSTFVVLLIFIIIYFMKTFSEGAEEVFRGYPFWMWLKKEDLEW